MTRRLMRSWLAVLSVGVVSCGSASGGGAGATSSGLSPSPSPSPTVTTSTTKAAPSSSSSSSASTAVRPPADRTSTVATPVRLYFLQHGGTLVPVHRVVSVQDGAVGTAAMRALLDGPSASERAASITTAVPAGTQLRGLTVARGIADVDLTGRFAAGGGSLSMTARVGQVVYTLTQFPTVQRVAFRLDGRRVTVLGGEGLLLDRLATRGDLTSLLPPIFVDVPSRGQPVTSPVEVRGLANVFEGQFRVQVRDRYGALLADVPATAGMGAYYPFRTVVHFTVPETVAGRVVAYDRSAKDGSVIDTFAVPVTLTAPATLPDGRYAARLVSVSAARHRMVVDVVQLFMGADAARAAAQDHAPEVPPPNDYWIRDVSAQHHVVPVARNAVITVNTLAADQTHSATTNVRISLARLASYPSGAGLFHVTVQHGVAIRIAEQYLP